MMLNEDNINRAIISIEDRLKQAQVHLLNSTGTAVAYGWYVWEKGYKGKPYIEWIN